MARTKTQSRKTSVGRSTAKEKQLLDGATRKDLENRLRDATDRRTQRVELRVTKRERELMDRLTEQFDVSMTELLVTLAEVAAERVGLSSTEV